VSHAAFVVRTMHASGPRDVGRSLDALHQEMVHSADGLPYVRLTVLNVVAACIDDHDAELATNVLTSIGARHPARVIVIHAHPNDDEESIEADVSLQRTSLGKHDVYTEVMRLEVHGEPAYHLTSIVQPLLIPDIPTDLWVVGSPRLVQAFSDDAVSLCDRIILDSGAFQSPAVTLRRIATEYEHRRGRLTIGDIAWERTRPWRELIAQAFDPPAARAWLQRVRSLRIDSLGDRPSAQAWLLAGWIAARMGWARGAEPIVMGAVPEPLESSGPVCLVSMSLAAEDDIRMLEVETLEGALSIVSDVTGGHVRRTMPYRVPDLVTVMARLMDEARDDPLYPEAVTRAAALAR